MIRGMFFCLLAMVSVGCATSTTDTYLGGRGLDTTILEQRPATLEVAPVDDQRRGQESWGEIWAWVPFNIFGMRSDFEYTQGQLSRHVWSIPTVVAEYASTSNLFREVTFQGETWDGSARITRPRNYQTPTEADFVIETVVPRLSVWRTLNTYGTGVFSILTAGALNSVKQGVEGEIEFRLRRVSDNAILARESFPVETTAFQESFFGLVKAVEANEFDLAKTEVVRVSGEFVGIVNEVLPDNGDLWFWEDVEIARQERLGIIPDRTTVTVNVQDSISNQPVLEVVSPSGLNTLESFEGSTYALLVGISDYAYADDGTGLSNLDSAAADAESVSRFLRTEMDVPLTNIKVLLNEEATFRNINLALGDWLRRVTEEDRLILFWAGHGYGDPKDDQRVYFACYDTDYRSPSSGIEMRYVKQRIREVNPRNVVAFLDTCHSGGFITSRNENKKTPRAVTKVMREGISSEPIPGGWIYFSAAQADQAAYEVSTLKNGIFTHYLLRGLGELEADGLGPLGIADNRVTMGELKYFLQNAARHEAYDKYQVGLDPVIVSDSHKSAVWDLSLP